MSLLQVLGLARRASSAPEPARAPEAAPADEGCPVFQEAALLLEDYHHVRVVITNLSPRGARIAFSARMDLPFRVRLVATTLKLKCWARVVWQNEGAAELEFQPDEEGAVQL